MYRVVLKDKMLTSCRVVLRLCYARSTDQVGRAMKVGEISKEKVEVVIPAHKMTHHGICANMSEDEIREDKRWECNRDTEI